MRSPFSHSTPARLSRRSVLATGAGFLAVGCIESPVIGGAYDVAKAELFGHPDLPIARSTIANLPYASMTARIGDGPQALLILGRVQGDEQHWISGADRSVLALRGGRVVRTFGFPENLRETRSPYDDPVNRLLHLVDQPVEHLRFVDLEQAGRSTLPIDSRFERIGDRKISILEIEFETVLVRERNAARTVPWSFENLYWVDPGDGYVWQSRQYIARSFPPVEFQILKPPSA